MIAREPHRLHHRLGARHVERHLVQPGDLPDAFDVVGDDGVIGAEHRPEVAHLLSAARDALLVEVVAKQIDAVGIGNVIQDVAVNIADGHAGGGFKHGTGGQVLADMAAILERDAVGRGELQIGGSALAPGRSARWSAGIVPDKARRAAKSHSVVGSRCSPVDCPSGRTGVRRTRRTAPAMQSVAPAAHVPQATGASPATVQSVAWP